MTPQEKAKQLLETYSNVGMGNGWAEQCALITVNEMIGNAGFIWGGRDVETGLSARDGFRKYWYEVKQVLENKKPYEETGYPMQ